MDEEIPENRIRGSSRNSKKSVPCPVCPGRFTNVRRHVLCGHLPWYSMPLTCCWTCHIQFAQERLLKVHTIEHHNKEEKPHTFTKEYEERWVHMMNGLLREIATRLETSVPDLVKLVKKDRDFVGCQTSVHHWDSLPLLRVFNQINRYDEADIPHKVSPPTGVHTLLHWRVLAILLRKTETTENMITFQEELDLHPPCSRRVIIETTELVDTHFHMDAFLREIRCSELPPFIWEDVEVKYLVSNYCFPHDWPSSRDRECIRKDPRIRMTYGIHPRVVNLESRRQLDDWVTDLKTLLGARRVVAVGECGMDNKDHPSKRELTRQVEVFQQQLQLAKSTKLPVVIHCRGNEEMNNRCLTTLEKTLDRNHHIHRHCFTENFETYRKWKKAFPDCKFGVSPLLFRTDRCPDLRETIAGMDLRDIIIETDAPFLSRERRRKGSPELVPEIAISLASLFNRPLEDIARVTTSNAMELYRL